MGFIQVPEEVSIISKATAGTSICSCSLGREGPEIAQAVSKLLSHPLRSHETSSKKCKKRLHCPIISMCWKTFLLFFPLRPLRRCRFRTAPARKQTNQENKNLSSKLSREEIFQIQHTFDSFLHSLSNLLCDFNNKLDKNATIIFL